jgi:hypothetical protein
MRPGYSPGLFSFAARFLAAAHGLLESANGFLRPTLRGQTGTTRGTASGSFDAALGDIGTSSGTVAGTYFHDVEFGLITANVSHRPT